MTKNIGLKLVKLIKIYMYIYKDYARINMCDNILLVKKIRSGLWKKIRLRQKNKTK